VVGQILTAAKFNDINTFEQPDKIKIAPFNDAKIKDEKLTIVLPPLSVVMLEIK